MKKLLLPTILSVFSVIYADAVPGDLLEKLDADAFATRSKAQKDLMKWAETAKDDEIKELKKAYEGTQSPEVKMRLFDILDNSTFIAKPNTRGFVGITMNPQFGGVGILRVEPNTPAQKVDLRVGDVIVEVDKRDLTDKKMDINEATDFFSTYVKGKNAGQKLELKINRGGEILEKTLKLGDYDEFNKQFLANPQFLQLNGNGIQIQPNGQQFQIQPGIQLKVLPRAPQDPQKLKQEADRQAKATIREAIERQEKLGNKEAVEKLKKIEKMLNDIELPKK